MTKKKTSRDTYAEWVKALPKGTYVKTYATEDHFISIVDRSTFVMVYDEPKKGKQNHS